MIIFCIILFYIINYKQTIYLRAGTHIIVDMNQCCYLLCSNLSANHLCIVGINFKLSCLFSCDIRKINCDILPKLTKLGISLCIILNSSFLFLYALHWVRKWISFSTVDGKNGQSVLFWGPMAVSAYHFLSRASHPIVVFRKCYPEFSIFNISEIAFKFHSVFKLSICTSFWERVDLCLP